MTSALVSIEETVRHVPELSDEQVAHLTSALIERENVMADMLRMAGMQFGLYPQIVAEVFAEVGVGTPVDDTQRTLIRGQFLALMEELSRGQQGGGQ